MMWGRAIGYFCLGLLMAWLLWGCVSVQVEPLLPFPDPPALQWTVCQPTKVCLSDADGDRLSKWLDKIRAYRAAIRRMEEAR